MLFEFPYNGLSDRSVERYFLYYVSIKLVYPSLELKMSIKALNIIIFNPLLPNVPF